MTPRFEWNGAKASSNLRKHGVTFETAQRVFADPFVVLEQDRIEHNELRWRAVGSPGGMFVLVVAHTYEDNGQEVIRIISARRANRAERRSYEEQDR